MYLAVIPPTQALPEREVSNFEAGTDQVVYGVEYVKVHDTKGRAGLCEEHVVYRLQAKIWLSGRAGRTSVRSASQKA